MIQWISNPWPWYVGGPLIALVMFLLLWFGRSFGVSSTMRTLCAIGGGGRVSEFFRFEWKAQRWNLVFVLGAAIGGFITNQFFPSPEAVSINPQTAADLATMGVPHETGLMPTAVFNWAALTTVPGFLIMIVGGFLIGFGSRYAGGCTSGHAISGLSNLQLPSLIAVCGFFIGGLAVTHWVLPWILSL